MNLFAGRCVQSHVMFPSRTDLRSVHLSKPDAIVWLGTVAIIVALFLIYLAW